MTWAATWCLDQFNSSAFLLSSWTKLPITMFFNLSDCLFPEPPILWGVLTGIHHVLKLTLAPFWYLMIRISGLVWTQKLYGNLICQHTNLTDCMTTEHLCNSLILYVIVHVHPNYMFIQDQRGLPLIHLWSCTMVTQEGCLFPLSSEGRNQV